MKLVHSLLGMVLVLASQLTAAQNVGVMRDQMELRMLVTGTVDVAPDGSVEAYTIDDREEIPREVLALIDRAAKQWRFERAAQEGSVASKQLGLSLKILARKVPNKRHEFLLRIDSAHFAEPELPEESIQALSMPPPTFPEGPLRDGATGTAYILLQVGRDGGVLDAVVERVDLTTLANGKRMASWRTAFADAALVAARDWRFRLPAHGREAHLPHWTIRVPVTYSISGESTKSPDRWEAYIPGPRQKAPWTDDVASLVSPDTFAGTGIHPVDGGRRLQTPLQPDD